VEVKKSALLLVLLAPPLVAQRPGPALRDVFREVRPSVVVVATKQKDAVEGSARGFVDMLGLGSGVVISDEGDVLTAAHVVAAADRILVSLADGTAVPAHVVASSISADVALVRLDAIPDGLVAAKLADSDRLEIGDPIFVVGHPYGLDYTLTTGVLSAKRRPKKVAGTMAMRELFQTDAAVNQGNSGGPMFNMQGEVVGIVSSVVSKTGGSQGLGFATPSNTARRLLLDEKAFWTGVEGYLVEDDMAGVLNLPQPAGFLVERVAEGSPGARLGLRSGTLRIAVEGEPVLLGGDVVLEVLGLPVGSDAALDRIAAALGRLRPGDSLTVKVLRGGKLLDLETQVTP
jgi:S1-C subfamily serine protease